MFADPLVIASAVLAAVSAAVYFYYYSPQANQPDIHPLQLAQQSSVSKTRASPEESTVHRSKSAPEGSPLLSTPARSTRTLRDAFRLGHQAAAAGDQLQAVVSDKTVKISANEAAARVLALASGLRALAAPSAVLYLEPASPEMLLAYQACVEAAVVAIPISEAESVENVQAIVKHSAAEVIVTSSRLAMALGARVAGSALKHAVVVGDLDGSDGAEAFRSAVAVTAFGDLETAEPQQEKEEPAIKPSDPAYVLYSAEGSGAAPRGVVITHANALSAIAGLTTALPAAQALTAKDRFMSAASLADPKNLNFVNISLMLGCRIFLLETTDSEKFSNHSYLFQPTFTYLEPMVLRDLIQLFYSHVIKYPSLELKLFKSGYRRALDSLMRGMVPKMSFFDFSYFRHYRNVMGGSLRLMYVDGPTTSSSNIEWVRIMHGAKVIPLFGTAQTTGIVTAGNFYDYASAIETHNVGAPLACCEIKIVNSDKPVPLTFDDQPYPRGRISVRGPNVAAGMWNAEPTVLTDGWLELPYFGELLPNGTIDVIGCMQTLVKNEQSPSGFLAVERLENALSASRAITDVCVVAESNSQKLWIIAHPRQMELYDVAKKTKKSYTMKEIGNYPWCAEYIRDKLLETIGEGEFAWIARLPKENVNVKLVSQPFGPRSNQLAMADGRNNRAAARKLVAGN
ncbi:medium-chain fatty acid-CoA ligase faa2 [Coemansia interrupta]|uniref:Medium-chain fatty acid-CoA ligase faa2 n=1 Tax=Coemansia interrupta TaxID=1126814 RepID=A0A9W8H8E8_9FUNG|nr:medium-chain fatty acid-CoA ligase faa2 [Coemansia interrupta]